MGTLRISKVFNDSMLTLIAVESVDLRLSKTNAGFQCYGNIKPIAVIVCSAEGTYALDMEAKPAQFDQLRREIPELDAIVAPLNRA